MMLSVVALLAAAQAQAASYVMDFDGLGEVPSSFGDSAEANVSFRAIQSLTANPGWGNSLLTAGSISFYGVGYGDLDGAAWADSNSSRGEIRIEATNPTDTVVVDSFDMGGWIPSMSASWRIFDLTWNLIDSGSGTTPAVSGRLPFAPGAGATGGVIFQWGDDAWDIGVQNFAFTVGRATTPATRISNDPPVVPNPPVPAPIPLPAAAPLLLSGIALLGWLRTRRRA